MKLYIICSRVSGNGGIETVLSNAVKHLSNIYNISLILMNDPTNKRWISGMPSNVTIDINKSSSKLSEINYLFKQFTKINNEDQVIILGANIIKLAYYYKKVFFKKWNIISWIHYSLEDQSMFDPHNLLYANYHLAISSSIKEQMINIGIPKDKIFLIYNPVSHKQLTNVPQNGNKLHLLFMGHILLNGQKNLKELFDGIKCYNNKFSSLTLDILGSPDEIDSCKNYAKRLGINDQIIWHNWTPNPWNLVINTIRPDALVLTSKFEGLPMVALEAMSYGIPCITSTFKGYKDVVKANINGLYYHQNDTEELADQLNLIRSSNFSSKVIKKSISLFYEEAYYHRFNQVLDKITNK